jgi:hypothetical protein
MDSGRAGAVITSEAERRGYGPVENAGGQVTNHPLSGAGTQQGFVGRG